MIHKCLPFLKEVGEFAVENQAGAAKNSRQKDDDIISVATHVDDYISDKFAEFAAREFGHIDPLIIDEEKVKDLGKNPIGKIKEAAHSFVIDPIDGTLTYAQGYPFFAISIGILKHGEPHEGVIYAPGTGELVYCDGKKTVAVSRAFAADESRREISPDDELSPLFITELGGLSTSRNYWNNSKGIRMIDPYSGVYKALSAISGKAMGFASFGFLWDLAGVWPMAKHAGMEIRDLETGAPLSLDDFREKDLRVHSDTFKIMSREKDFDYLRSIIEKGAARW